MGRFARADPHADGIIALHRGERIYERYFGVLQPQRPHSCFSITKSYAATLAASLIHERTLDENRRVTYYLPEMADTAYDDATVRQLLDMQIGVEYSEVMRTEAHIWEYARAGRFSRTVRITRARQLLRVSGHA